MTRFPPLAWLKMLRIAFSGEAETGSPHKARINEESSRARAATLLCRNGLGGAARQALHRSRQGRGRLAGGNMAHPVDKHFVQRANTVLLLTVLWGALAACALGAVAYDIVYWLKAW
jgi:hypothetical protein